MSRTLRYWIVLMVVLFACGTLWGQKATVPKPADGAMDVILPLLQWVPAPGIASQNVYLGTTPELGEDDLIQSAPASLGLIYYMPPGIVPGTTYYWRVDSVAQDGTVIEGDTWSFFAQTQSAHHPDPADGSNMVLLTPDLTWLAGQGKPSHQVYFSENFEDVNNADPAADKGLFEFADANFAPGMLEPTTTYYWRVDEILTETNPGKVWSFTTVLPVDGFETYTDAEGEEIFMAWIDGFEDPTNGSLVGHAASANGTFGETAIVRSGSQSMPLYYDNTIAPYLSEATKTLGGDNWSAGLESLVFYVRGGAGTRDFEILPADPAPVIDGEVDDVWAAASIQPIMNTINGAEPSGPDDISGQFRVLYDNENLYALVDVNDDMLVNDTSQTWQDDSVEFYIDADNEKAPAGLGGNRRQYTFGWGDTAIQGTNTATDGVEHAQVDTATGWRIEIKFPWQSLMGSDAPVGELIGIDSFLNDDDDGDNTRETQVSWHAEDGSGWNTSAQWGTALVATGPSAGQDLVYVTLEDTGNGQGTVADPDTGLRTARDWTPVIFALSDFADQGVNLSRIDTVTIGVGDPNDPGEGSSGLMFIDDVFLTVAPAAE